ncbi:hypothetical protein J7X11_004632 [Vibrio parahaemolyticus]|nr:hypothetical protein [Vibrio parahaemolyticus]EHR6926835.1 hypothetical protein [Vibrio parahaemolyticus]EHW0649267.1 hypothetical protein [Vibrio parahaemolyticus]
MRRNGKPFTLVLEVMFDRLPNGFRRGGVSGILNLIVVGLIQSGEQSAQRNKQMMAATLKNAEILLLLLPDESV